MQYLFLLLMLVMMFLNFPVWVAVGSASFLGQAMSGLENGSLILSLMNYINGFTLLAVPFYILAGNIMSRGSIAKGMLHVAQVLTGGKRESTAIATILASAFFAAISGSSVVTVAALGPLTIPMMVKQGYKKSYACAIAAAGAIVGPIIPPSVSMVIYGVQTSTSITDLFLGGIVPGLMLSFGFIIVFLLTKKHNIDYSVPLEGMKDHYTVKDKLQAVWDAKWSLLMPVIVLGGIYGGIFTPTEAAIVACDYAIIVSLFITKEMNLKDIFQCIRPTVASQGALLLLCGVSQGLGRCLTLNQIPQQFATSVMSLSDNPVIIMLLITIIGLIAGCFMEAITAMVILTPILLPLAQYCGLTPLQFGIAICVNMTIGTITPPFGVNLFVTTTTTKEPIAEIVKSVIPFLISAIVILLLITMVPQISSFLPDVF